MKVIDFIGERVRYIKDAQMIFGVKGDKEQLLLDVRGWGAIQNLFRDHPNPQAEKFQDELGEWFVEAINEKLERELNNN